MNYQVWTKDDYQNFVKKDCPDMAAAQANILAALKAGKEPLLTVAVPWGVEITIKEDKIGETTESPAEPNQGAVAQGDSAV
jgi:hypothetical protein